MGDEIYSCFMEGLNSPPPISVRLNPYKNCSEVISSEFNYQPVPWCRNAYYLGIRPPFTMDPLLHSGTYYVQDASSMFLDQVLRQHINKPVLMLDLCAAPGGKTTVARTALPEGSLIIANEPIPIRAQILSENIQKYGHPDMIVTQNYPADHLNSGLTFDVILADVPCSGEGMFRKDEGAVREWSVKNVADCSRLQRDIVKTAWTMLRPGGLLIYSTCTFNLKENEENVKWMIEELGAEPLSVKVDNQWGILGSFMPNFNAPVYRFIPGFTKGEGLFMCVMKKNDVGTAQFKKKHKTDKRHDKRQKIVIPNNIISWLKDKEEYTFKLINGFIYAIPNQWEDIVDGLSCLKVIHAGVKLAQLKGKDYVPQTSLALSLALQIDSFPTCHLDYSSAIAYLRRESIVLPSSMPHGYVIMSYNGHPIGFSKNLGTRSNNLYPQEWKIRSSYVAEKWDFLVHK